MMASRPQRTMKKLNAGEDKVDGNSGGNENEDDK